MGGLWWLKVWMLSAFAASLCWKLRRAPVSLLFLLSVLAENSGESGVSTNTVGCEFDLCDSFCVCYWSKSRGELTCCWRKAHTQPPQLVVL